MKHIPALFSTPMVQAIQNDTKTITRRTGGLEKINEDSNNWVYHRFYNGFAKFTEKHNAINEVYVKCPFGEIGDILWVREAFYAYGYWAENGVTEKTKQLAFKFIDETEKLGLSYRYFDNKPNNVNSSDDNRRGWYLRPSIHMPKAACRLWLEKTATRAERLQDITNEDAKNEGVLLYESGTHWLNYEDQHFNTTQFIYNCNDAAESFKTLWWLINGRESWFANPWVWVNSFKKVEKPAGWPAQ